MDPQSQPKAALNIPTAIIIAAVIIAISIVWIKKPTGTVVSSTASSTIAIPSAQTSLAPVTSSDHILGNPNAPIKIVEFSDPSCPYCKLFYPVMQQVMNTYGASGQVAWVYRAFPLDKPDANGNILHPNAGHESQALECAAVLGGNDKFWAYTNRLYSITPSVTPSTPNGLDQTQLSVIAQYVGLNVNAFNSCLSSGETAATVNTEYQEGVAAGVDGTPYSFIITSGSSTLIPIAGAETYAQLKLILDQLVASEATNASSSAQ